MAFSSKSFFEDATFLENRHIDPRSWHTDPQDKLTTSEAFKKGGSMANRKLRFGIKPRSTVGAKKPRPTNGRYAKKTPERRAHRRYTLKKGAFAMLRAHSSGLENISDMSMGEIGMAVIKSKPIKLGEIKNVSHSGLSFHYAAGRKQSRGARKIDIVLAENAICLKGLNFRTIADTDVDEGRPYAPIKTKQQQVQFLDLTSRQKAMLERLIQSHTDDGAPTR